MVEEYNSIMANDVWEVVPRPEYRSVVSSRWIYKIKYATADIVEKYNGRFVEKGDCRPRSTPVITNWKKIDASDDKDVNPTLYQQLIGPLMYLVNTKPHICFLVNTLSQFMVEPKRVHWAVARHILRYVRNIVEYVLRYTRGDEVRLCGFIDANRAGSSIDRKSTPGYYFSVGSGMVSWCSR
eukprot:PITA_04120